MDSNRSASNSPRASGKDAESFNLKDLWRLLSRRRWVLFACMGVVVGVALVFNLFARPEYRATTTLHIERQGPDILTFKDVMNVDPANYRDFHDTQYEIVQSRTVASLAAERLDLVHRPEFLNRRKSPLSRLIAWTREKLRGPGPEVDPRDRAVRFIEEGLSVHPLYSTQLVKVSFDDRDPSLAQEAANAVADAYLEFNFRARYGTTAQATEFLTKEVSRIQAEITEMQRRLQSNTASREILAIGEDGPNISEKALSDLSDRHTEARTRLAKAQARYRAVRNAPADALPEVLNSPLIASLKGEYAELDRQHGQMAERFKSDWPPMQELEEKLERASERLRIEIGEIARRVSGVAKNEYEEARQELARITALFESQKTEVRRVNQGAIEVASLKAEIENRKQVLSDLVTRQSEAGVSDRLKTTSASNVRVVDRAERPRSPVRPRRTLNMALSLIIGLLLGTGLALLVDTLDNTVKSEQDIRQSVGLPILAQIPFVQSLRLVGGAGDADRPNLASADFFSPQGNRSALVEAFKNLRTSLLLATPQEPPATIVVTSCEPSAGKSTISLNLAVVLSQMGRRVLLVDADLRKPRIHKALELPNDTGLSSLLSGNAELGEAIQDPGIANLRVITSGPSPPNPSELLGSAVLPGLIRSFREPLHFDHVVFDSSPILSVSDGTILASRTDGTILVVRAAQTVREALGQGAERLRSAHARLIGVVLNAASEGSAGYYYGAYESADGDAPAAAETATATTSAARGSRWTRRLRRHGRA